MNRQAQRIERLIEIRQRDIDQELALLGVARRELSLAQEELAEVRNRLRAALEERSQLAAGILDVQHWMGLQEWLETLNVKEQRALRQLSVVKMQERKAVARVANAHRKKEQAVLLKERIMQSLKLKQIRAERRADDEIAGRLALRRSES
jgi:flagellar biosynthesis chaperone FliJ